ncbi:MAG TPA: L,D-transpeptidase [Longimicrobiaceae bacterium]|nr:L,D-transpeptidase [Longimicrobiaceae bacterium]
MENRTTRAGGPERRNHTPPGRLRRIAHDYRTFVLALIGAGVAVAVLFVATTAWAVNERFERDVAHIAYTHDARALHFLAERQSEGLAELSDSVAALTAQSEALVPSEEPYLVVSIADRRVWYLSGEDTIFSAPVAVGSGETLVIGGETKRFQTPRGRMKITHKEKNPIWVPPNWHYIEIAREQGLEVVNMSNAAPDALAGFPAGDEPIADGKIYIPPWGSPQRRYEGVLGAAKLEMYDGYYFHGTQNEASVGSAASHGCIRMLEGDVLWMYANVPVGTEVYIY